ncbi:MAG: FkbM family methyltransferase [Chitinivibrionales bacterium]|nr:FkbM family methyltransferase [Chitinivibrionales bacterium]MBD3396067.1 FkbM family methyltransferase [Chitinivibrionales bacterium]
MNPAARPDAETLMRISSSSPDTNAPHTRSGPRNVPPPASRTNEPGAVVNEYLKTIDFAPMDYPRATIHMAQGIRTNSAGKEPETVQWVETALQQGDVLYDIGACVGAYSLVAASFWGESIRVYAFEPGFQNFPLLVQNVLKNGFADIISPVNLPVSRKLSLNEFNHAGLRDGSALHAYGQPVDYKGTVFTPSFRQLSLSVSVDELVSRFSLPAPTAMKLDVDSIELDILRGARAALSNPSFRTLLVEATEAKDAVPIRELMHECGLGLVSVDRGHLTGNYIYARGGGS